MKRIRLLAPLEFIITGTVLIRNTEGNYFISRSDEEHVNSPINVPVGMCISGDYLRARPELYEIVDSADTQSAHREEALRELQQLEDALLSTTCTDTLTIANRLKRAILRL